MSFLFTCIQCKKDKDIAQVRAICREKLRTVDVTPLQYLYSLRETIEELRPEDFSDSDSDGESEQDITSQCVVCFQPRGVTMMFLPCQHCNTCQHCSDLLWQVDQRCPVCRSPIEQRLVAYQ